MMISGSVRWAYENGEIKAGITKSRLDKRHLRGFPSTIQRRRVDGRHHPGIPLSSDASFDVYGPGEEGWDSGELG